MILSRFYSLKLKKRYLHVAELCTWISSELPILYVYQNGISEVQSQMSVKEGHCYLKNFRRVLISDKKKVLKITNECLIFLGMQNIYSTV